MARLPDTMRTLVILSFGKNTPNNEKPELLVSVLPVRMLGQNKRVRYKKTFACVAKAFDFVATRQNRVRMALFRIVLAIGENQMDGCAFFCTWLGG